MIGINFGLLAVAEDGRILHFAGYEMPPEKEDILSLREELDSEEEFGLIGVSYEIVHAPQEVVVAYRKSYEIALEDKTFREGFCE